MTVPCYGAVEDDLPQEECLGWKERGCVTWLLQDVFLQYGTHLGILVYMFTGALIGGLHLDRDFSCELEPNNKVIQTHIGSATCEYSKTYVWSFPQVAFASLILLIGRDLAQKRFYYCLLKNDGVMRFRPFPLHYDSVILANLWVFGHFWIFVGLVLLRLYVNGADPHIAIREVAKAAAASAANPTDHRVKYDQDTLANSGDPHGLQLLIKLLAWLGMPGLLVIGKLLSAYNLEYTLVPLSEYVSDSSIANLHNKDPNFSNQLGDDDRKDIEARAGCLKSVALNSGQAGSVGNLVCVKDNCMRALLQLHQDSILEKEGSADECYANLLDLYWQEAWYKLRREPPNVELLEGLWPAPFVLATESARLTQEHDWSFSTAWNVYRKIGSAVCCFMIFIQVVAVIVDIIRVFAEHALAGFAVAGECINIYFIGLVWHRLYAAHAPVEGSHELKGKEQKFTLSDQLSDQVSARSS